MTTRCEWCGQQVIGLQGHVVGCLVLQAVEVVPCGRHLCAVMPDGSHRTVSVFVFDREEVK